MRIVLSMLAIAWSISSFAQSVPAKSIDRFALVTRNNVVLKKVDTLGSLSVGNGEFAFTADVTGLQTFYEEYDNGISLGTQSQWAWHSIPAGKKYTLNEVAKLYESCDGTKAPYAVQQKEGIAGEATEALRANPHRLHLGLIGLIITKTNGDAVALSDLKNIHQQLNLWTGKLESKFDIEGTEVKVITIAHPDEDGIAVRVESPLISSGRLKVNFRFPYGKNCHVCPGYDWSKAEAHRSEIITKQKELTVIERTLDSTRYYAQVTHKSSTFDEAKKHHFVLSPDKNSALEFTVIFKKRNIATPVLFNTVSDKATISWKKFWTEGAAIDFGTCTDPRAKELERRVILSQYLTRIQCAGTLPPQETGLTMNSWYGKFHLEMHWWHAAQFALWNRSDLLARSMPWYTQTLHKAKATAKWQGYTGARWQKMTDPFGNESPSSVGAFIIWQQPHPLYFAELLYRANPGKETLLQYKDIVFETAGFMASFVKLREGKYHLCHPLIPAQEIFKSTETDDPAYELQYWYYGLSIAQEWRKRLGMAEDKTWSAILKDLAPLAKDATGKLYLPNSTTPTAYTDDFFRRDHPAVVGALGFLPANARVDPAIMSNTFVEIMNRWQWETTWGWDYPLLAMTAARLNKPEQAIDILMKDAQKNIYLVNGHNYQDTRLRLYLPGNGGLLAAIAMMAAGWDGNTEVNPGFPKNGKWNVRWEGLRKMP